MLKILKDFINTKTPTKAQALGVMRLLFASMFMAQLAVACLLAFILFLLTEKQTTSGLIPQILIFFTLIQIPLGISLPMFAARKGGKGAALTAIILMGVILSTPAWFAAFAFLIGSESIYLIFMLILIILSYTAGFLLCNRYADVSLLEPQPDKL